LGNIKHFNGENFHLRKFQMCAILMGKELLKGIVDRSEIKLIIVGVAQVDRNKHDNQGISLL